MVRIGSLGWNFAEVEGEGVCVGEGMLVRRPECKLLMTKKNLSCFGAEA